MSDYGLNTVKDSKRVDTPDARNGELDIYGRKWITRKGGAKGNTISIDSPIYFLHNFKSGFCKEDYFFARTGAGDFMVDPENLWSDYSAITNCTELQAMSDDVTASYYLANDIDCTFCTQDPGGALYNGGLGFDPIVDFSGTFDGRGHTITGLKVNRPLELRMGLFQDIFSATIKNLGLIDVDITGLNGGGGLVGYANNTSTIKGCYSTGSVAADNQPGNFSAGGLIGRTTAAGAGAAGTGPTIADCYSTCSVVDSYMAGGLIGRMEKGTTVSSSYSTGLVSSATYSGGFLAFLDATGNSVSGCYWDKETSGKSSSAAGTGKTTAEMMEQATFDGWDFTNTWSIEGNAYPILRT